MFSFGTITKKLSIPFLLAVAETLYKISSDYFPTYSACDNPEEGECKKECIILDLATTSLS